MQNSNIFYSKHCYVFNFGWKNVGAIEIPQIMMDSERDLGKVKKKIEFSIKGGEAHCSENEIKLVEIA